MMLCCVDLFVSACYFCFIKFIQGISFSEELLLFCFGFSVLGYFYLGKFFAERLAHQELGGDRPVVEWGVVRYWNRKFSSAVFQFVPSRCFG